MKLLISQVNWRMSPSGQSSEEYILTITIPSQCIKVTH